MTATAPPLRAIFFDVDFTLIYPGPTFQAEGYAQFCAREGVEIDPAQFDTAVAAASFILDEIEEPVYDDALFIHYTATIIEQMGGRGPGVIRAARGIYDQWPANHHFELYDDVAPTLAMLAGCGYRLGVISNSHRSLDAFREHFRLVEVITCGITSAEHGYMKPHRSIFDSALVRAGVQADEAMMVGDSYKADIEGAVAAGLRAVLLRRSGDQVGNIAAGVRVIRTLRELPELL